MTYKTYEDRVQEAADVIRTLTPEQVDAVKVLAGLMDTIGALRNEINRYPNRGELQAHQQHDVDRFHAMMDQYVVFSRAMSEVTK